MKEARQLVHEMCNLPSDSVGNAQVDQILADIKVDLLKKSKGVNSFVKSAESHSGTELTASSEESAAMLVALAVPEERQRIMELLTRFPDGIET